MTRDIGVVLEEVAGTSDSSGQVSSCPKRDSLKQEHFTHCEDARVDYTRLGTYLRCPERVATKRVHCTR